MIQCFYLQINKKFHAPTLTYLMFVKNVISSIFLKISVAFTPHAKHAHHALKHALLSYINLCDNPSKTNI